MSAFHALPHMKKSSYLAKTSPPLAEQTMKRLTTSSAFVALLTALSVACTGDVPLPSAAPPSDPTLAKGGGPAAYTALDVGALIGDYASQANGVNDAGDVVGYYYSSPSYFPFALVSGSPVTLGGGSGFALGMSNASPAYVVGSVGDDPVRWSLADPTQPTILPRTVDELAANARGAAKGVNDAGDAVGYVGLDAAMWLADGTRIPIATPLRFVSGQGRGIDNDGLAVFQFFTSSSTSGERGFLRLVSGDLVVLPPEGTDVSSFVNDIGEVANGLVYVAGSTSSSTQISRSVRWTVDAATGAIVATDVLATTSAHGLAVSDAGGIAGFIENDHTSRLEAYLWRGTNVLKLAPPKGGKDGRVWAMSRSGQYLAGQAVFGGLVNSAVRWTIAVP